MKSQNDKLRNELKFLNEKLTNLIEKSKPAIYKRERARNSQNFDANRNGDKGPNEPSKSEILL